MNAALNKGRLVVASWLLVVAVPGAGSESQPVSLAGEWRFALDRADVGVKEGWFNRNLSDRVQLPGILQAQGFGDEISVDTPWVLSLYDQNWHQREDYRAHTNAGNVRVPFVSQPARHYLGVAWYQRDIEISTNWTGRRVGLFLERTRWETRAWLNDRPLGTNHSLCTPHEFEAGVVTEPGDATRPDAIHPGRHRLTIRVDNRMLMNYRPDAHAVSDSLGSTWNGIVGAIELHSTTPVWIEAIRLTPALDRNGVAVVLHTRNTTGRAVAAPLVMLQVVPKNFGGNALRPLQQSATIEPGAGTLTLFFPMGDQFERWCEFNPRVYSLRATIGGAGFHSQIADTFGMRDFKAVGTDFIINGRPTHLRGTHHGGDFPLTGHPPCDVEYWVKLFQTCKEWGLNHVRFHSFCPPKAAFEAADRVGIYLQPEPGMWNEISPGTPMERMLYEETERMNRYYGNHPSFVLCSPSNEPKGRWKDSLPQWVAHFRERDSRRLYTTGTGWSLIDDPQPVADRVDYLAVHRVGPRLMRGESGWFGRDYAASYRGVDVPNIVHENGQWCAYPDFDVIRKFTGFIRPGNYEIFRDSLAAQGMLHRNKDFAWASGRFQLACYKEEIEANLRTPGLAGFQLLDLHDYTGQGTALVGVLDPFWETKGYATADEWRQFCNTTVPLARLRERVLTTASAFDVPVEVAHYGPVALTNLVVSWEIADVRGHTALRGEWPVQTLAIGRTLNIGNVRADLASLRTPAQYRLTVRVIEAARLQPAAPTTRASFENSWNFWVYPAEVNPDVPQDMLLTSSWEEAERKLADGGKVLFQPSPADLDWSSPPLDRLPVFWNRLMNPGWGRMLGLWCDTNHPALAGFPTEANCDWQWTSIIRGVRAMKLDRLPSQLQPIVQAIDDWNRNWKLGLVYECKVGSGRLLVCTVNLQDDLDRRPVARQLRRSLLDYLAGDHFQPRVEVTARQFRDVLFDSRIMSRLGATAEAEGVNPQAAIDGDPNTFWLVSAPVRGTKPLPRPHPLTVSFPQPVAIKGVVLMPRQNDRNHQGGIREYRLETSDDGQQWDEIRSGTLASTFNPLTVDFGRIVTMSHLRLTSLSGFGEDPATALAELTVIPAEPRFGGKGMDPVEYQRVRSTSTDVEESN